MTVAKLSTGMGFIQRLLSAPPLLPEHSRVRALRDIRDGDESIPAGAVGTIVHVIKDGVGYDVEFTSPKHVVISATRSELAPA
jgi:Domain of unknown function (DUF4926)